MQNEMDLAIKKRCWKLHFQKTRHYGKLYPHEIQILNIHILGANPVKKSSQFKHNLTNPFCYKSTYGNGKDKTK
jgi:hypothetical protein